MNTHKLPFVLAYLGGAAKLIATLGQTLTTPAQINNYLLPMHPQTYWAQRIQANLYIASTGLLFMTVIIFLGAYLLSSTEPSRHKLGQLLLLLAIIPELITITLICGFTPSDWTHSLAHVATAILLIAALAFDQQKKSLRVA